MLRFAASGQTDLIYRRRENIRIAQKNLGASLILTGLLVGVIGVGSAVWSQLLNLGGFLLDYDPVLQAALASFAFFFMLMTCCCVCASIVGVYGVKLGIRDNFNGDADS